VRARRGTLRNMAASTCIALRSKFAADGAL
jgi:hypothetical protein